MNSYFKKQFGTDEGIRIYQAPARINIIGEHVDYLGGLVLPAAIDFYVQAALRPNDRNTYRLYSVNYESFWETPEITKSDKSPWANYILGVVDELETRGHSIPGFDLVFGGEIPPGSGLSSSAALEVVIGYGLNDTFNLGLNKKEIALIGQAAENHFVGTKCGIMDQFIIAHGKENHCIALNTATLEFSYHVFDLKEYEFSLIQSNVKHSLNDSEYNTRRKECESALRKIQDHRRFHTLSEVNHLYDMDWNTNLDIYDLSKEEAMRTRHVLSEKERTGRVIQSLESGDFQSVGDALTECHWSLSKDFQVSCPETDFLVEYLNENGSLGSRMIGGGFGGCVLTLAKKGHVQSVMEDLNIQYMKKFGKKADVLNFKIADGVKRIQ